MSKPKRLKKELNLLDVYAIATGTTLSGGFFLLPGIAAAYAGPALILSYFIATIPLIPAIFCLMELSTAMPRAGGAYYFLDRSMGPMIGTIGGLGTWFSLTLKIAFALVGMGAYLNLFFSGNYITVLAISLAIFFGLINLMGAKDSGKFQLFLVSGILLFLSGFIIDGLFHIEPMHFSNFWSTDFDTLLATAGLVYVSFGGITKVTSVSEEVKNPERNLPLGMFLAFATAIVVYGFGTYIMVGVLGPDQLANNLTPVATTAEKILGFWGKVLVTIAAIFAFSSVANAGILSASRYPLAMSRDHLMSRRFQKLNKKGLPKNAIILTVGVIIGFLIFLNPTKIAKLASAFQLLVFAMCCCAVIIMRESHIEAYDPGYKSPLYPWMQIFGTISPFFLIVEMGWLSILFSLGLIAACVAWYFYYARKHVSRDGAIYHVFERWGRQRYEGLEPELRGILKEKGLRDHDPFNELIASAEVIDLETKECFDKIITDAARLLSKKISYPEDKIETEFLQGTKIGATPVANGVALPHMRLNHLREPEILLVRARAGVDTNMGTEFWGEHTPEDSINAIFFLISPEENPGQHLRILANIANRVDDEHFLDEWLQAKNEQDLKEILLRDEHYLSLKLKANNKSATLIGKMLKEVQMPADCLIAIIRREGKTIVPRGDTILEKEDRLTIIGNQKGIRNFRSQYCPDH